MEIIKGDKAIHTEKEWENYYYFLENIRQSGVCNMWGASYSEVIDNFEKAFNLPTRPAEHTYSENHIFDEDKSVKWNREEVARRNEEIRNERNTLQTNRYKAINEAEIEIIKYLCESYPTISENVVKKTFDKVYDDSFRDRFNCTIQYVIDECEEFLSIFSEE